MAYNKNDIDRQAEREGTALKQQGCESSQQHKRKREEQEYNKAEFDRLFKR